MKFKIVSSVAIAAASIFMMGSCEADPDSPGLEYMPDMYRSPAIEPYVDYGEIRNQEIMDFKMNISALVPPAGTVPYYGTDSATVSMMLPYHLLANYAYKTDQGMYNEELSPKNIDTYELAAADVNPLKLTAENADAIFKSGKEIFNSKCMHCHGEKGDGNGPMTESGAFVGAANLTTLEIADGQMFYSIYYGKGNMGSHRSLLNKKEIWTMVHYIRKFQDADYGPGAETAVEAVEEGAAEPAAPETPEHNDAH